jgi:hypothetical protein
LGYARRVVKVVSVLLVEIRKTPALDQTQKTYRYWSVEIIALIEEISKPKSMPPVVATIARK